MSGAVLSYQQKDPMIIIDSKSLPIPVLATGKGWLVTATRQNTLPNP
jgi:hypothetical protein